jgi:hypothetical protein
MKSAWLTMILAGICWGQTPLSTDKMSVSGSVISAAGEPLRRVTVRLTPPPIVLGPSSEAPVSNLETGTDLQGNFSFDDVSPGRYMLSADRPGYLPAVYSNARSPVLTIRPGQKPNDILIKMTPQGIIAGKVVDEERESLPGVTVTVRLTSAPGQPEGVELPGNTGTTDADGAFAIGGLRPGRYVVSVAAPPTVALPAKSSPVRTQEEAYVTTYYPDATDLAQAAQVEVGAGAQVRGLELRLQRVPVFNVKGKIISAAKGEAVYPTLLNLIRQGSGVPGLSARASGIREGEFFFDRVSPGTYILETKPIAGTQDHPPLVGCQIVSVGNGDLDRVVVEMKPGIELSGRILVEGAAVTSWPQITLTPTDGLNYLDSAMVGADGRFAFTGLEPTHYRVAVGSIPPPLYVKSVRFNGLDLAGVLTMTFRDVNSTGAGDIDLASAPAASLEIVVAYGTSSISGLVSDFEGPVGPAVNVMATRRNEALPRFAQTDENGRYSIAGLPPGEYSVLAMDTGPGMLWPKIIEKLGKTVTVDEGATVTTDLRLTSNDDVRAIDSR